MLGYTEHSLILLLSSTATTPSEAWLTFGRGALVQWAASGLDGERMREMVGRRRGSRAVIAAVVLLAAAGCTSDDAEVTGDGEIEGVSVLVTFDIDGAEFPEGVTVDHEGNVYASLSPLGQLVRVAAGTEVAQPFGVVEGLEEGDLGLLGLTVDGDGNVYGAVASANPDAKGVWRFDRETGDADRVAGTEQIVFANAIIFDGSTMYVTDTVGPDEQGAVWRVSESGEAEIWAQDAVLAGDGSAGFPFPLGPNGIDVHDGMVYVGLTEPAQIATIAIEDDGSAGEVLIFADLTTSAPDGGPAAVDGIGVAADGSVYVAAPLVHTVFRVSADGAEVATVATAEDGLDGPASLVLGDGVMYVSNFSAALGASNNNGPGIIRAPL